MKKLLSLGFVSILAVTLLAGCGGVKTYTDPGEKIKVWVGDEFIIALDSNPTTGYDWEEDHDDSRLSLVDAEYKPDEKAAGLVGAGGTQYFRFRALVSEKAYIILTYKRPWEEPSQDDVKIIFSIEIK